MSSLMTTLKRFFGGPVGDEKAREAALEEFKTAVRDGNVASMDALFDSKRLTLADELGGGRGLLQFAVMAKSVKAVTLLIGRGAKPDQRDSLGASAATLGKKSDNPKMAMALRPA